MVPGEISRICDGCGLYFEPAGIIDLFNASFKSKRRTVLKKRIKGILLPVSAILIFACMPGLAQDFTGIMEVPTTAPASPAHRPTSWGVPEGRMFFPHNSVRGYTDFSFAPPHNEPDLGRCNPSFAAIVSAGGAASTCNAYARYLWSGYLEVQPFGKTFARHSFFFFPPTVSFVNNVPECKYTPSSLGMTFAPTLGHGVELPK